jgi:hypothetical protein
MKASICRIFVIFVHNKDIELLSMALLLMMNELSSTYCSTQSCINGIYRFEQVTIKKYSGFRVYATT